jgi:hypothetical protein
MGTHMYVGEKKKGEEMRGTLYWNGGRPRLQIGTVNKDMGTAICPRNWRSWCLRYGIRFVDSSRGAGRCASVCQEGVIRLPRTGSQGRGRSCCNVLAANSDNQ